MPNFINGSRLKRYEKPLTEEMLTQLHRAKTYKEGQKRLQEQAQWEAKMHQKQIKERKHAQIFMILQVDDTNQETEHIPPFLLDMQLVQTSKALSTKALIDSGADCNVLSYATWESLGRPALEPCKMTLQSFLNTQSSCLGKICLKVQIQTEAMYVTFYVVNKNHKGFAVLLGRSWMCSTNCQINLRSKTYTLEVNSVNLTGKGSKEGLPTTERMPNQATKSTPNTSSQPHPPKQRQAHPPHNPVQGRGESQKLFYWRPKDPTSQPSQPSKALPMAKPRPIGQRQPQQLWKWLPKNRPKDTKPEPSKACYSSRDRPQKSPTKKWIPKATLRAQGYYKGNSQIWIPRSPQKVLSVQSLPPVSKKPTTVKPAAKPKSTRVEYHWRIKVDFNKKKYPAPKKSMESTSRVGNDLPSTSFNSTVPAKAKLLQLLLHHRGCMLLC